MAHRRYLVTTLAIALLAAPAGVLTTGAAFGDGGSTQWSTSYGDGDPLLSFDATLSPDGSQLFVTGLTSTDENSHFQTVAFSASGERQWADTFTGENEFGIPFTAEVSPDGDTVYVGGRVKCKVSCGLDTTVRGMAVVAYATKTGKRRWVATSGAYNGTVYDIVVAPDGDRIYVRGNYTPQTAAKATATIAYSADGEQLWVHEAPAGQEDLGGGLVLAPDGQTLYVGDTAIDQNGCDWQGGFRVTALDTADGTADWSQTHRVVDDVDDGYCGTVKDLALSPDGSTLVVTGHAKGPVRNRYPATTMALDAETGGQLWATTHPEITVFDGDTYITLGIAPDASTVYVGGYGDCTTEDCDGTAAATVALDLADGSPVWTSTWDGYGEMFSTDLVVSPDGASVFITGQHADNCFACSQRAINAPVVAYDAQSGAERWVTSFADNVGQALAVSPDSKSLYLAGTLTASAVARAGTYRRASDCGSSCGYATARINLVPGPGTFDDTDASIVYEGWRSEFHKDAVGGAHRSSRSRQDTATFTTPPTTEVAWLTRVGPKAGKARISVDGKRAKTVDLYAASPSGRTITFKGLPRRAHVVKVTVLGKRRAASRGTWVAVDGFTFRAANGIAHEMSRDIAYTGWSGRSGVRTAVGDRFATRRGATARFAFTGRTVLWRTRTGPTYGRALVTIDGERRVVDLYRAGRDKRMALRFTELGKGRHRLTVRVLGGQQRGARGSGVVIDAFVVRR